MNFSNLFLSDFVLDSSAYYFFINFKLQTLYWIKKKKELSSNDYTKAFLKFKHHVLSDCEVIRVWVQCLFFAKSPGPIQIHHGDKIDSVFVIFCKKLLELICRNQITRHYHIISLYCEMWFKKYQGSLHYFWSTLIYHCNITIFNLDMFLFTLSRFSPRNNEWHIICCSTPICTL